MLEIKQRYHLTDFCISHAPEQTILCPANVGGAMGSGVAKAIKQRFPTTYEQYKKVCQAGELTPTSLAIFKNGNKQILVFPTKVMFWDDSDFQLIDNNLRKLAHYWKFLGIKSLALTSLGTGCGKLKNTDAVIGLIRQHLDPIELRSTLYI